MRLARTAAMILREARSQSFKTRDYFVSVQDILMLLESGAKRLNVNELQGGVGFMHQVL